MKAVGFSRVCPAPNRPEAMESTRNRSSGPVIPGLGFGFHRSLSPTRQSHFLSSHPSASPPPSSASAFRYRGFPATSIPLARSINLRSVSPRRNLKCESKDNNRIRPRRTCMCSPTNHPGSFRCSLHRNTSENNSGGRGLTDARRSAMRNSLVRICAVEGDFMVKRALSSLIRPSSHQLRRRCEFHPTPSRLSHMTKANG